MASLNKVQLIGNLGNDPEARSLSNGSEVVNLSVATTDTWKDRDGNRQERTEWHRVVIFNEGLGGIAKQYLRKGSRVYLEGALQTRKWQDNNGNDKYSTEIVLQKFRGEMVLLDSRQDRQEQEVDSFRDTLGGQGRSRQNPDFDSDLDDSVPFLTCDPSLEWRVR